MLTQRRRGRSARAVCASSVGPVNPQPYWSTVATPVPSAWPRATAAQPVAPLTEAMIGMITTEEISEIRGKLAKDAIRRQGITVRAGTPLTAVALVSDRAAVLMRQLRPRVRSGFDREAVDVALHVVQAGSLVQLRSPLLQGDRQRVGLTHGEQAEDLGPVPECLRDLTGSEGRCAHDRDADADGLEQHESEGLGVRAVDQQVGGPDQVVGP